MIIMQLTDNADIGIDWKHMFINESGMATLLTLPYTFLK